MPITSASILSLLISGAVLQGPSYTLQRKLVPGDTDHYTMKMGMDQKLDMMSMGPQNIQSTLEADYLFKVGSLLPGGRSAKVKAVVRTSKMSMGGMMGSRSLPMPKEITESGTLDSRNRFSAQQTDSAPLSQIMGIGGGNPAQSMGMTIELPDHPVKIGDSWTMELPGMAAMGIEGHKLKVTLLGKGEAGSRAVWNVKISGSYPVTMDMSKIMGAAAASASQANAFADMAKNMKMTMTGTLSVSGLGTVDQKSGKTASLKYTMGTDFLINIAMPAGAVPGQSSAQSMKMKVAGTTKTDLELVGH